MFVSMNETKIQIVIIFSNYNRMETKIVLIVKFLVYIDHPKIFRYMLIYNLL